VNREEGVEGVEGVEGCVWTGMGSVIVKGNDSRDDIKGIKGIKDVKDVKDLRGHNISRHTGNG
jgi:hypothetical protein